MGVFDNIVSGAKNVGGKLSDVAKVAASKTEGAVETAKLKAKITSQKNEQAKLKKQIGELVWTKFTAGEAFSEDITKLCADILTAQDKIDAIKAELEKTGETDDTTEETTEE